MLLTRFFLPVLKENPKEAEIISHIYMLRAGMIQQSASGIYSWLPLGKIVLEKITEICRQEMIKAGANEILMPTLQSAEIWKESGRYEDYGKEMLRIKDRNNRNLLYGPTNEELVTEIFRTHVNSYKQLPLNLFHIQWKFRDELRPRFGVMRGREFLMKDAYSFDVDYKSSIKSYNIMFIAYLQLFKKMGLKAIPMKADTGPIGGDLSHEFIIIADTGESEVYVDKQLLNIEGSFLNINYNEDLQEEVNKFTSLYAATEEKHDASNFDDKNNTLIKTRGIEVGHIFHFGQKYSLPMRATISDRVGDNIPVFMGSYGVGLSRLVGAVIEANHDQKGIIWPKALAPFEVALVEVNPKKKDEIKEKSSEIYNLLKENDIDVLWDDREKRPGVKFTDMEVTGIPLTIIIGERTLETGEIEIKKRQDEKPQLVSHQNLISTVKTN